MLNQRLTEDVQIGAQLWITGARAAAVGHDLYRLLAHPVAGGAPPAGPPSRPTVALTDGSALAIRTAQELNVRASCVWLNLDDVDLVRLSGSLTVPIRWVAPGEPMTILGPLLDRFDGAYFRVAPEAALVCRMGDRVETYALAAGVARTAELAMACALARQLGVPPERLRTWLQAGGRAGGRAAGASRGRREAGATAGA
ncbi:MAG: hypothetical protein KGN76_10315 [Acidobacteriota bacterium]|nr:hypothetical protein [Acidobacteriota bacterium]